MATDCRSLQIKVVRGMTQPMTMWIRRSGSPVDISTWVFNFTMRTNYTLKQPTVALQYRPIVNQGDPTQGQLMWGIQGPDTEQLYPGQYVFDITVTMSDQVLRFFCGGQIPLFDNVTDPGPGVQPTLIR